MKETYRFAYTLVCGVALCLSVLIYIFAPQFIQLFMHQESIVSTGAEMLRAQLVGEVFIGFVMVTTCLFQSCGKASGSLLLSAGRQGYIYFVILTIMKMVLGYTGILYAQPVSDLLCALLALILLKKLLIPELREERYIQSQTVSQNA